MDQPLEFVIGSTSADFVRVAVLGRERAADDYWDGNWLITPIEVAAGAWRGSLPGDLRAEELTRFRTELQRVYESHSGTATLESLDGWISLTVECTRSGSLTVEGVADDRPGIGNRLHFTISDLDQSHLPPIIDALIEVERQYPVIGQP